MDSLARDVDTALNDQMLGEMNDTIHGEVVNITQGGAQNIDAQSVTIKQGGVRMSAPSR